MQFVEGSQRAITSSFESYNNIVHEGRNKSISEIVAQNNSLDNTCRQPGHELNTSTSNETAVDTALNDSLMLSPMNIHDISIASDAFSSNDSYDRLRIIINDREEGNDGYGIAMRNLQ